MIDKMQEAVMLSIRPYWVNLIRSGEKTVEVRRTFPGNVFLPFTCYIYETQNEGGAGAVVGEFLCDEIYDIEGDPEGYICHFDSADACMSDEDYDEYLNGRNGYGWEITELKMYDTPVSLEAFNMEMTRPPQSWRYVRKLK